MRNGLSTDVSNRVNVIYGGRLTWMTKVGLPFTRELYEALATSGIAETDATIEVTAERYEHEGPSNSLDWHEFLTVQFLVVDGLAVWLLNKGFDTISAGLVGAFKRLLRRHKKTTSAAPAGLAVRIEASFNNGQDVICLESDLHLDSDVAALTNAFQAACEQVARSGSTGLHVFRADSGQPRPRPRPVSADRARVTRRAVQGYSRAVLDPTAGPLQKAIEAHTDGPTKLMRVAQLLERNAGVPFPAKVLADACGCSERLITEQLLDRLGDARRYLTSYQEPWADRRSMTFFRFDAPRRPSPGHKGPYATML